MNLLIASLAFVVAVVAALVGVSRLNSWSVERRNPPVGAFAEIEGMRIHYVHVPGPPGAPAIVFIHGASANLKDQMAPLRPLLEGRAEMLFWDRPGYGWSSRGQGTQTPQDQARILSLLMDQIGIRHAVVVGHSFGGAAETAFALAYPERVRGLVFLSPATHPWPGGGTSWYYGLSATPLIGRLFVETLANPAGALRMADATRCVFAPNPVPAGYLDRASIGLILRPASFRANASDVESLYPYALANAPRYTSIRAPTVIITGDHDTVVAEEIHSRGLAHDIAGAELVWVRNLGHKPDWIAPDLVAAAIGKLLGDPVDLQAMARDVERRIAPDRSGEDCLDEKIAPQELAPQ